MKGGVILHFTSYLQDGQLTVALTGEIDHQCAKSYIDAIASKIEVYTPRECILDFSEVYFMDSSGIAVVINALRNMTKINGMLSVAGLQSQPLRVFQVSGIDRLVKIKEEAL
jgi:stage II sporulation protein AA (anti-sigma F factor antagonist)